MWVIANRDFAYGHDDQRIRAGQLFRLQGCRNDGLMLKHKTVVALDPQPEKEAELNTYPRCGECGRRFITPHQRDRCGELHETAPAVARSERKAQAQQRVGAFA